MVGTHNIFAEEMSSGIIPLTHHPFFCSEDLRSPTHPPSPPQKVETGASPSTFIYTKSSLKTFAHGPDNSSENSLSTAPWVKTVEGDSTEALLTEAGLTYILGNHTDKSQL